MDVFEGVRVIEMASWQFVPAAAAALADFGADVVMVEPRGGDPQRAMAPPGSPAMTLSMQPCRAELAAAIAEHDLAHWRRASASIDGCAEPLGPAPGLGEHTDEILGKIGYAPDDIAALRRSGTVG
jgi:crotonobetainyl-CoA:carnitine CoA-transferase CaiB-like acyl-CoA transferase